MGDAAPMAMKQLPRIVHRQAVVMGCGDAFFLLTLFLFQPQPPDHAAEEAGLGRNRAGALKASAPFGRSLYCKSSPMHL
jgi:hypothetical protein